MAKSYRPINYSIVLACVSKIFESLIEKKLLAYIDTFLSSFIWGCRKGFSSQTAPLCLRKERKAVLDKKCFAGRILMDLTKTFDVINHELLIAKLHAYSFEKVLWSYLTNRWQRTKIRTVLNSLTEIIKWVLQGSLLGPILFDQFLSYLFFLLKETDICGYADGTTPYARDQNLDQLICRLEHDFFSIN